MNRKSVLIGTSSLLTLSICLFIFWKIRSPSNVVKVPILIAAETNRIVKGLSIPWQMHWMPPSSILFTELTGQIKQVDVSTGKIRSLYQVNDLAREVQSGLMGLALHPRFEEIGLIYIVYNYYLSDQIFMRIDALRIQGNQLVLEKTIVDKIPSFAISIGGRLLCTPDEKLFLTVGEGADSETAQDPLVLPGKILRYNLDGSIPADNPDPASSVWSSGFRNPQGLTMGPAGLYATEHGTFSNDELNLISKGSNHGWPLVSGMCLKDDHCSDDGFKYALASWTPTVAPSGLAFYDSNKYSFLKNSLLVSCLKGQKIKVITLSPDGTQVIKSLEILNGTLGRIRDVLVDPNGRIFASTSNQDVYGLPREGGDAIYEIFPIDTLIVEPKKYLSPPATITLDSTNLTITVVAEKLRLPWELVWVQDQRIWFNERGGAIKQLNLDTRAIKLIHQVPDVFESTDNSGMHGFTVHPDYPSKPYFYVHYTYELYKSRLERFEVDTANLTVINSQILLPSLEGNKSHNGSRIVFGPDKKLYFCIGDGYKRRAAQKLDRYNGKILRLNDDGSIPADNPFPDSHIWTLGHRNPQGLTWAANGRLYSSEHGSSNDDEINIILEGNNYGFPNVQGLCNDRSEKRFCERHSVVEPIYTWTPTIGPSGIDHYAHQMIPEWNNSLLITTLKSGDGISGQRLLQAKLDARGERILEVNDFLTYAFGRLRDVMVAPDGRIFICTSNQESNQNAHEIVQKIDDRIIELKAISSEVKPLL